MEARKRPEHEAEAIDRFRAPEGVLACHLRDFRVSGLHAEMDEPPLLS